MSTLSRDSELLTSVAVTVLDVGFKSRGNVANLSLAASSLCTQRRVPYPLSSPPLRGTMRRVSADAVSVSHAENLYC